MYPGDCLFPVPQEEWLAVDEFSGTGQYAGVKGTPLVVAGRVECNSGAGMVD